MTLPTIDGLIVLPTRHTAAEVLTRIVSIAKARGITVFAQIDFSGDAARSKLSLRPTGLVIFRNPTAGTPLMAATPTVAVDLPLKLLTFEDAAGRTWAAYNDPEYLQTATRSSRDAHSQSCSNPRVGQAATAAD